MSDIEWRAGLYVHENRVVVPADIIYAAGIFDERGRVLATRDGGKSWVEVFNEATTNNPVRSIALNPANPNEIVIGLASGAVIKSEDSGNNWRLLQNYGDRINRIRWQESLYVLTRTKGLYQSSDGGASFRNITNSILPSNNFLSHASGLLIFSALCFALSLWSYQGAKILVPLIIFSLLIFSKQLFLIKKHILLFSLITFFLVSLPILFSLFSPVVLGRATVTSVFSYPPEESYIHRISDDEGNPSDKIVDMLFHSNTLFFAQTFLTRFYNHISPRSSFLISSLSLARSSFNFSAYFVK
jgi:hypothetical protein